MEDMLSQAHMAAGLDIPPALNLCLVSFVTASCSYGIATRLRGAVRGSLLSVLAAALFLAPPYLADVCQSVLMVQSFTCILGSQGFKVAALAMNRGVLAKELAAGCSMWRFLGACMLPIIPTNAGASKLTATSGEVVAKLQKSVLKLSTFGLVTLMGMWALYGPPQIFRDDADEGYMSVAADASYQGLGQAKASAAGAAWSWIRPFLYYLSGLCLWLEVDGMGDLVDALALACFGISSEPHFRMPVLAQTVSNYWSRHWNLTMTSMLRELVFWPLLEGRIMRAPSHPSSSAGSAPAPKSLAKDSASSLMRGGSRCGSGSERHLADSTPVPESSEAAHPGPALGVERPLISRTSTTSSSGHSETSPSNSGTLSHCPSNVSEGTARRQGPSKWRKLAGSMATFAASGLWHELVFYQMSGGHTTYGYWTMFFLMQAPFIFLETLFYRWLTKAGITLPKPVQWLLVNLYVLAMVTCFWAPPLVRPVSMHCPAHLGGSGQHSVFEQIMAQGHRDIKATLQLLTAGTTLLSSSVLGGGGAVQDLVSKVQQGALCGSMDMTLWLRDAVNSLRP